MKTKIALFIFCICVLCACSGLGKTETEMLIVPVDVNQQASISIGDIAAHIQEIELELTDESPIERPRKVLFGKDRIVVVDGFLRSTILAFDGSGKFLRTIGSVGQGPGEFSQLTDVTLDDKTGYFYLVANNKLICYDPDGKLIRETRIHFHPNQIQYKNDKLYVFRTVFGPASSGDGNSCSTSMYTFTTDFQLTDSCFVRETLMEMMMVMTPSSESITSDGNKLYLYFPEELASAETFTKDTVYELRNNELIPAVKLQFSDEGATYEGVKNKTIYGIHQSSRYLFAYYRLIPKGWYYFCYDKKEQKGYNLTNGFKEEKYQFENIQLSPSNSDPNTFYYTKAKEVDEGEEPNPTLFIVKLKE